VRIANLSGRLVLVTDAGAIDVESASAGRFSSDPQRAYERWFEFVEWAEKTPSGEPVPIDRQQLGPRVSGTVHGGDMYFRAAMSDVYAANVRDIHGFAGQPRQRS
jgi:hypothetical protein